MKYFATDKHGHVSEPFEDRDDAAVDLFKKCGKAKTCTTHRWNESLTPGFNMQFHDRHKYTKHLSSKVSLASILESIASKDLEKLKKHADNLTIEHEKAKSEFHKHFLNYLKPYGFSTEDYNNPAEYKRNAINEHEGLFRQRLDNTHPELHKRLSYLENEAPKARLAYKRALRSQ
jgi:hypothetical protein